MTTENPQPYAQDESQKRFQDSSWDRNSRDDSWKERVAESQAEQAVVAAEAGPALIVGCRSVTIASTKYAASLAFYRDFLGCEVKYDIEVGNATPPMRQATLVAPNGFNINITGRGVDKPVPADRWVPPIRMTFDVSDRELAFERIETMGIAQYEPEFQGPYGPVFTVLDPDNNLINLLCPKTAPDWRQ